MKKKLNLFTGTVKSQKIRPAWNSVLVYFTQNENMHKKKGTFECLDLSVFVTDSALFKTVTKCKTIVYRP